MTVDLLPGDGKLIELRSSGLDIDKALERDPENRRG